MRTDQELLQELEETTDGWARLNSHQRHILLGLRRWQEEASYNYYGATNVIDLDLYRRQRYRR